MIEQPAGWEEHLEPVVTLVMCLDGVVGREVMCLVGEPWHTVLAILLSSLLISLWTRHNTGGGTRWVQTRDHSRKCTKKATKKQKTQIPVSGVPPAQQPQAWLIDSPHQAVGWGLGILLLRLSDLRLGRTCVYKLLRHNSHPDLLPRVHEQVMMLPLLYRILPHPDRLSLVKPGRMLKTLSRNENVIKELQADMDSFLAATFNLPS